MLKLVKRLSPIVIVSILSFGLTGCTFIFQKTRRADIERISKLKNKYHFRLSTGLLKVAVNDEFKAWDTPLNSGDRIVFIPPVAGG
ncbi:MAG: MoaD/ThiS family protein [Bacteroidetes bacterium]|nr:MoaD/ThiS family protein [Bacteroidota bacterium]